MRDFTLNIYKKLLETALAKGYNFSSYKDYIRNKPAGKTIILRHDVDDRPQNSLATAVLENKLGIKGSYYFRIVKQSFNEEIIGKIEELGHEIGYHYEDMALNSGDYEKSYAHFKQQLEKFRKISDIQTICMHGSPLSNFDNRALWKKYNYRELGIIAEPYFDTDFSRVLYLTDTGRKWNNTAASIRDKVEGSLKLSVDSTEHLVYLFEKNQLPDQIMINIHPQRWTNNSALWMKELLWQNVKNVIKSFIVKSKSS
jgi:hypothetical protein